VKRRNADLGALRRLARAAQAGEPFVPGCSGKVRYGSGKAANAALLELKAASKRKATIYRCDNPDCRGWHITSHPRKGKR
jgi:hypothetical protein